jgi:N-methylhydantoinase B
VVVVRADGSTEDHAVVSGLTVNCDEVIRIMTATGAGWGDPMQRPIELVKDDLKNGYVTEEQAVKYYGWGKR